MTELAVREGEGMTTVEIQGVGLVSIPDSMIEAYPALNPELDLASLLEGALGPGGKLRLSDLTRIKVPSAELKRLMVPDEDGDDEPVNELTGLPVAMTSRRSWWSDPQPSGKVPECTSRDLEHGIGVFGPGSERNPSGKCADCPMSQIGSMKEIAPDRKETNASACKEQRLLFILTDRELLPLMLVVPPGSLPNHKTFGVKLAKRGVMGPARPDLGMTPSGRPVRASAWLAVEVGIGLEQKTNPAGQAYNMLTFRQVRKLGPDELAVLNAYGRGIDELIVEQAASLDDVAGDSAAGGTPRAADADVIDVEVDDDGLPADEVDLDGVGSGSRKNR